MSEPHAINLQDQQVQSLLWSVLNYISESKTQDLIQRCVEEFWDLDAARDHVAFQALLLEWYLTDTGHPNPERHALTVIKQNASAEDFELLDGSLKIITPSVSTSRA